MAQRVKCLPAMRETRVRSLGQEDPLEKEMATHSSILAWRLPWTEEPGRLQFMGSQRVGHDWATSLSLSLFQRNQRSNCQYPLDQRKSKGVPEKYLLLLYWLCQSLWLCGFSTLENSSRDGNIRSPYLPSEKLACRSPKPLTVWIKTSCGKFLKSWEYQTTLPASWKTWM